MIIHLTQPDYRSCGHTCVLMIYASTRQGTLPSLSGYTHPDGLSVFEIRNLLKGQGYHIESSFEWTRWRHFPIIVRCVDPIAHYIVVWGRRGRDLHISDPSRSYDDWCPLNDFIRRNPSQLITTNLASIVDTVNFNLGSLAVALLDLVALYFFMQGSGLGVQVLLLASSWITHVIYQRYLDKVSMTEWITQLDITSKDSSSQVSDDEFRRMFHVKNARLYERANHVLIGLQLFLIFLMLIVTIHWIMIMQLGVLMITYFYLPKLRTRFSMNDLIIRTSQMTADFLQRRSDEVIGRYCTIQSRYRQLKRWHIAWTMINLVIPIVVISACQLDLLVPFDLNKITHDGWWYLAITYGYTIYSWIGLQIQPYSSANNATHMI